MQLFDIQSRKVEKFMIRALPFGPILVDHSTRLANFVAAERIIESPP